MVIGHVRTPLLSLCRNGFVMNFDFVAFDLDTVKLLMSLFVSLASCVLVEATRSTSTGFESVRQH